MKVLLADDEVTVFVTLRDALEEAGHDVLGATDTRSALEALEDRGGGVPEVVITDIRMPGGSGIDVLRKAVELDPDRPVILMTGYATIEDAVDSMRLGAVDYIQKPFRNETILKRLETLSRVRDLETENEALRGQLDHGSGFADVIGESQSMRAVFERVRTVAGSDATALIVGESGTGKERIARALHDLSSRSEGPFVAISCAALPETLLEAELFGHEKGAFTDARKERRGRFELADEGTLFLDDVDDMPLPTQVKLLRVLQERTFERVGGERTRSVDIRVVVASKVDLRTQVREGLFREDLFYRLNVVPIPLPPLRERTGDVALLVQHLLERHGRGRAYTLPASALAMLERYPWPGNVRELENAVQRGIALAGGGAELAAEDLLPQDSRWRGALEVHDEIQPLRDLLTQTERAHVRRALEATGGHRSQAASLLGISRKVLWEKLKTHGLGQDEGGAADGQGD
ncbi:DNA-binding response regulator [Candidatus Woesearchaeota archaeon]|jgi:DNA-binding NtrC family response regulator|nr:DNA-binding response regulator [Candidatus Woesearchaeota archaeon]MDP6739745.1 sigma-54 dependent transcriptional regulator [Planctomycetota bacterium]MDP6938311.1 sigma-54 dependent transcriptional regulator [Planctomycetota bacterium]